MNSRGQLFFLFALSALSLLSCSINLGGSVPASKYYTLVPASDPQSTVVNTNQRLLVYEFATLKSLDTGRIYFKNASNVVGSYQFAFWAEPPTRMLTALLIEALEQKKLFSSVGQYTSPAGGTFILVPELLELFHDATKEPGAAVIRIRVELIDSRTNTVLDAKLFEASSPATSFDAPGAIAGFNAAWNEITIDIISWIEETVQS